MHARTEELLAEFTAAEALPEDYPVLARRWFVPLADWLLQRWQAQDRPLLVGLHGAQGTGKTTLCSVLEVLLRAEGCRVLTLSLDDFYLTRAERRQLAAEVHPLLVTRGVPGTHDVALMRRSLETLLAGKRCRLPRFDKSRDDRVDDGDWWEAQPADVIILEGWCVGSVPETDAALLTAVNDLEAAEDPDGAWRGYVNARLQEEYAQLFELFDCLVMLQAPSLGAVLEWRTLQEHKLARARQGDGVMNDSAIKRFVQHYQRITRHSLEQLPQRADYLLRLTADHRIESAEAR